MLVAAYIELSQRLEEVHQETASSCGTVADCLRAVIDRVVEMELPRTPPVMTSKITRWAFYDPGYTKLDEIQQHLVLMGRDNAHAVQSKLAELRADFGWEAKGMPAGEGSAIPDEALEPLVKTLETLWR